MSFAIRSIAGPLPLAIAHRGGALLAPENSAEAFEQAKAVGAEMVETDVRLSGPKDFARLILSRGPIRPVIPAGRFDVDPCEAPRLATYWVDEDDPDLRRIPTNRDFLRG